MPRIRSKRKRPPAGFEKLEPVLDELEANLREAEAKSHEGLRKCESVWPIFRINHQRSRYVYDMFYRRKEISRELYEWLLREGYADAGLIAKWKKVGYERLCCLRCITNKEHSFGTSCICRVPRKDLEDDRVQCVHCGCRGCCSGDGGRSDKGPQMDPWGKKTMEDDEEEEYSEEEEVEESKLEDDEQ
eukprot:TRINITY_DN777882_c0_g1_i1.p1 TRINITY_DN777882_c0_g1~~TRINITY_DN777882_c0_g1_i1.p1  ORF type:complete len:188 (-),score=62.99 TRINITY_DN777882_c0_g1_i1:107-670(-)